MINVNEYFDGKVRSLGFELDGTQYTAGVMLPGEYTFSTENEEHITVTAGGFEILRAGGNWRGARVGDTFVIPAHSAFNVRVKKPASYICMYK